MNTTKTTRYHASIDPATEKVRITETEGYFLDNEERFVFTDGYKWHIEMAPWYAETKELAIKHLVGRLENGIISNTETADTFRQNRSTAMQALAELRKTP